MPWLPGNRFNGGPSWNDGFLDWLRSGLINKKKISSCPRELIPDAKGFPFLELPVNVRRLIYRYTILPPNNMVHSFLCRKIDERTENIIPLFLTCRSIHGEAEEVLYSHAVFSACCVTYQRLLIEFIYARTPAQLKLIQKLYFRDLDRWVDNRDFMMFLAHHPHIDDLNYGVIWFSNPCFGVATLL